MITLSKEQVKSLHTKLIDATGGMDGIRDEAMLNSALFAAFQTFDGIELYPSVAGKITRIGLDLANGRMDDRQLLDFIIAHIK